MATTEDSLFARHEAGKRRVEELEKTVSILEKRRDTILQQIDTDQAAAKVEQQRQIDAMLKASEEPLRALEDLRESGEQSLKDLGVKVNELTRKKNDLEALIDGHQVTVTRLLKSQDEATTITNKLRAEKEQTQAYLDELIPRVRALENRQAEVEELVRQAEARRVEVENAIEKAESDFKTQRQLFEREMSTLRHNKEELVASIQDERAQINRAREELAARAKVLDKRDKIVRVREARVAQDEQTIAENTELLKM